MVMIWPCEDPRSGQSRTRRFSLLHTCLLLIVFFLGLIFSEIVACNGMALPKAMRPWMGATKKNGNLKIDLPRFECPKVNCTGETAAGLSGAGNVKLTASSSLDQCPPPPIQTTLTGTCICFEESVLLQVSDQILVDRVYAGSMISASYWETRYKSGGNSGEGSYGELAEYKAAVINSLVSTRNLRSVAEFGCGDGANLRFYTAIPLYVGFDVSSTVILARKKEWENSTTRTFREFDTAKGAGQAARADLSLSLDVLYHILELDVWKKYLLNLFMTADKCVLIYGKDTNSARSEFSRNTHVLTRKFTDYISLRFPCWHRVEIFEKKPIHLLKLSSATFFLYERKDCCVQF